MWTYGIVLKKKTLSDTFNDFYKNNNIKCMHGKLKQQKNIFNDKKLKELTNIIKNSKRFLKIKIFLKDVTYAYLVNTTDDVE